MVRESHREDQEIERVTACFGNLRKSQATPNRQLNTQIELTQQFVKEKLTLDMDLMIHGLVA